MPSTSCCRSSLWRVDWRLLRSWLQLDRMNHRCRRSGAWCCRSIQEIADQISQDRSWGIPLRESRYSRGKVHKSYGLRKLGTVQHPCTVISSAYRLRELGDQWWPRSGYLFRMACGAYGRQFSVSSLRLCNPPPSANFPAHRLHNATSLHCEPNANNHWGLDIIPPLGWRR